MAHFLVSDKGITFKLSMQEQEHVCLYGDDVRLRQVLLNLLGNAVKFTERGFVQLTVVITDDTIRMTVKDTGTGIPEKNLPTLFDAFEQADIEKNRYKTGTGLGLTITKAIVEMMDGRITVESVCGQGASFHVEIPKILGDEIQIQRFDGSDAGIYAPDALILVVDDNQTNLNVACGLLRIFGIEAETASSGKQAIEMIQQKQYDIVFMDHRMPVMSGVEATRILRDIGIDVTIIALTASAIVGAREMMIESGMNDYLWKPIVKTELVRILKKWIPPEKQLTPPSEMSVSLEAEDDEHREFWDKAEQIEGLSVSTGLNRVDGQRDVYKKSLKLLLYEIDKSNKNLSAFLAACDLDNFRIEVHGIKGALANAGAINLSAIAYDLEMASDRLDAGYCAKSLPVLVNGLNVLKINLKEAFKVLNHSGSPIEIPPELPPIMQKLTEAFDEIDLVLIDKEIENLSALNLSGALKEKTEQIKDAVMVMDYEGAAERIMQLLNMEVMIQEN
jgi:CheY-like chemotaxis protein/HPt (histidine-containing phosphotransfer) domain-containing protein/anti-sigma regulatory factor (Ser/Thr protein kinase)